MLSLTGSPRGATVAHRMFRGDKTSSPPEIAGLIFAGYITQMKPRKTPEHALLETATANAKAGDFEQAIIHLKMLLQENPTHEIATGMLGGIYAELKMTDRAIECFRRVLEINPSNPLARFHLGLLQLSKQQLDEAVTTFKASLEQPADFLSHFHSGLALLQLHKPGEARKLLEQAARRMPKDHVFYPQLQHLLDQLNKYH